MKKPTALMHLIEDLQEENINSDVGAYSTSKAIIYLDDMALENENGIILNADECRLIFANTDTAERFVEALDLHSRKQHKKPTYLALIELNITDDVLEVLECNFTAVDEE